MLQAARREVRGMPSKPVSYEKALAKIYSLDRFGSRLGLERISRILVLLGSPEKNYKCVLVAGSNGKGSTVEMLGCIFSSNGWKTGTYFSPQIEEFPERIRINSRNADKCEIAAAYSEVAAVCSKNSIPATFFEVVTAMALLVFSWRRVKFAVLEVGLGGRLDATNAVEPDISAIASISLEHTEVLGGTVEQIAHEKCGIARKGKPLVVGQVGGATRKAIERECIAMGAKPVFVSDDVRVGKLVKKGSCYAFSAAFNRANYSISLSTPGKFQVSNACSALAVASLLGAKRQAIEKGLRSAAPKYRLQAISKHPLVIADCCHNPGAAFAIAAELRGLFGKKILLFSAMRDKDYGQVLDILRPFFSQLVLTEVSLERAASVGEMEKAAKRAGFMPIGVKNPAKALAQAKRLAGENGTLLIAGSVYLLAELFGKDKIQIAQ